MENTQRVDICSQTIGWVLLVMDLFVENQNQFMDEAGRGEGTGTRHLIPLIIYFQWASLRAVRFFLFSTSPSKLNNQNSFSIKRLLCACKAFNHIGRFKIPIGFQAKKSGLNCSSTICHFENKIDSAWLSGSSRFCCRNWPFFPRHGEMNSDLPVKVEVEPEAFLRVHRKIMRDAGVSTGKSYHQACGGR